LLLRRPDAGRVGGSPGRVQLARRTLSRVARRSRDGRHPL